MTPISDLKDKIANIVTRTDHGSWHQLIGLLIMGAKTEDPFRMTVRHMVNVLTHIHNQHMAGICIPDVVVNPFPTVWKFETVEPLPYAAYISFDLVSESSDIVGFLCDTIDRIGGECRQLNPSFSME